MDIPVMIVMLLLVGTKLLDVLSTIKQVSAHSETNPIAGPLMRRYGVTAVSWSVFALVVAIVLIVGIGAIASGSDAYKIMVTVLGAIIAIIQLAVARTISTGHTNFISRQILKLHSFF